MVWTEILTAFSLFLIIEGMVPFIGPNRYRRIVAQIAQLSDNHIRTVGLISMLAGVGLLFLVRA